MSVRMIRILFLFTGVVGGCSGETPTDGDADADTDADVDGWRVDPPTEPVAPALPVPPDLPRLRSWDCPEGWLAVQHESVADETGNPFSWCEPPPLPRLRVPGYVTPLEDDEGEGERPLCEPAEDGTYPVVGHADCQLLGDPCPGGTWPEVPPEVTGARVFVLEGAHAGDGSQTTPFGSLSEAVSSATPGDVVVVGPGTYRETIVLDRDITLWGRCVQDSIIEAPGPTRPYSDHGAGAVFVVAGVEATLRNLRVGGEQSGVNSSGNTRLDGVWISAATDVGVHVVGGRTELSSVLVTSTVRSTAAWYSPGGNALTVSGGGALVADDATFENNKAATIYATESTLELVDVLVRSAGAGWSALPGFGLVVDVGGEVTARRLVVDRTTRNGIFVTTPATPAVISNPPVLELEDVVMRRAGQQGLTVCNQSQAHVTRGLFDGFSAPGVHLWRDPASFVGPAATLDDVVVLGIQQSACGNHDQAIGAFGGDLTLRRTLVDRCVDFGIGMHEGALGTSADFQDVIVRDIQAGCGKFRGGIGIGDGVGATMRRILVERSVALGIVFFAHMRIPGDAHLEDITVSDTEIDIDSSYGFGIGVERPGEVTIERASIERCRWAGVGMMSTGVDATLRDITVRGTRSNLVDEESGSGLMVRDGAAVALERGLFDDNLSKGICIRDEGTTGQLSDVTVVGTVPNETDDPMGYGVHVYDGAECRISRARIAESTGAGLLVAGVGTVSSVEDLEVAGTLHRVDAESRPAAGVAVVSGANLVVARASIDDSAHLGLLADGDDTDLTLEDALVTEGLPDDLGILGAGFRLGNSASATVLRALLDGNYQSGIEATGASSLSLEHVLVRDTASAVYDSRFGRGLSVEGGCEVIARDCQFIGNRDVSVSAFGADTTMSLEHVLIADSLVRACAELDEVDDFYCTAGRGYGLGVYEGAAVVVDDVEVADAERVGLQLASGGIISGQDLRIHNCPVAVNLQSVPEGYDWVSAVDGSLVEGCEVERDDSEMGVPEDLPPQE